MPVLDWVNRNDAVSLAQDTPYHLLQPISVHGIGDPTGLLIQGDSVKALKALLPFYSGRVQCIYDDPPFNTEQAFPDYDDNLEHSQWLSMMYPILKLQYELLADSGAIFVHIDDNELGHLLPMMDEIFDARNRVGIITFKQGAAVGFKAINPGVTSVTNFIVIYAKNKPKWKSSRVFIARDRDERYNQFLVNPDEHHSRWTLEPLLAAFAKSGGMKISALKKHLGSEDYAIELNKFVLANADRVIRNARPDFEGVSEAAREMILRSKSNSEEVFLLERDDYSNMYFKNGERWIFYRDKLKFIENEWVAGEPLTSLWDDLLSNNLHKEGNVEFPKSKKPEALIRRILDLSTQPEDLVLDAFLGSGTTAAVAHKMGRHYIGIEKGEHAVSKCIPRLEHVINGDPNGISKSVKWAGGGCFRFSEVGEALIDSDGCINSAVTFEVLAHYLWHLETGSPASGPFSDALLGKHSGTAFYLLFNGILGDKRFDGGNVLNSRILTWLLKEHPHEGPKVVYGEMSSCGARHLAQRNITFKQIPYELRAQ